ncbi:MAG: hypothetical protein KDI36_15245 [Pseudomonadales bacterium]|nr:hypothetical protein [Pseudomonadales bacterium]
MAKRRYVLSSQEMTDYKTRIKTLESQLKRSNARVDELEHGLGQIGKLLKKKSKPRNVEDLCLNVQELVNLTINPPVTARLEREAAEELELEESEID